MKKKIIKDVTQFIKSIPQFESKDWKISESSQKLLRNAYAKSKNLPQDALEGEIKPPLIISFHPKASLLNNNIHETYLSECVAKKLGMQPIWIPYVYDTGYKTAANKIRLPTYVLFEGKYLPIRASAKIRGNIMATEKPLSEKEVKTFFRELNKHEISMLAKMKSILNPFNFGHALFDIKRKLSGYNKKKIQKRVSEMETIWLNAIKGSRKLAESLANISLSHFKHQGIDIALLMMDDILQDTVKTIFTEVLECENIKKDPSILENLFLSYELKTKERAPIMYTGDNQFIGFDDYDVKVFDGSLNDVVEGLGEHTVLPTGHLIMTLFTALGCKLVLGGAHTIEYYPDYLEKAYDVLHETSFNSQMKLLSYGKIRFMDMRNFNDLVSTVRILDKVGSRNYIKSGEFVIPDDVVDHLNFLAGSDSVPEEYHRILDSIIGSQTDKNTDNSGDKKPTALEKEAKRHRDVEKVCATKPEDLLKDPQVLKKWIRGTKFDNLHPVRLEVLLENLKFDADMRYRKMQENVQFERHILGGSDVDGIVYDGIINRSNRYPSLFELVFYNIKPQIEFNQQGHLKDHENKFIWKIFEHSDIKSSELSSHVFKDYKDAFEYLIPHELLPDFM